MFTRAVAFLMIITVLLSFSVDHHRWLIKTTVAHHIHADTIALKDIIKMEDPPGIKMNDKQYDASLIPAFKNKLKLKEGDLICVKGYLHLVASEKDDGDYHIQISSSKTNGDNCFIVEVPDPAPVKDKWLKKQFTAVREVVNGLLEEDGLKPTAKGAISKSHPLVYVTGQLFYDNSHTHNQKRGKQGMQSYCLWEIHPIVRMEVVGGN
jgi:hypothetical protein